MILSYKDKTPEIHKSVFIAKTAVIIGDVKIKKESSVWFNAVIRGDVNFIRIGEGTNIQDGCILHVTHNKYPLRIGSGITIGHNAVVHGCTIKDNILIGMGSVLLDNSVINSNSIIAAGALVKENTIVPEGVLFAGLPGKIVRKLTKNEIRNIKKSAGNYIKYALNYKKIIF